jgi:phenylacetate-coenzyme A ligase PaaK-like adenylate-forming protein
MNPVVQKIYWSLPPAARDTAASLHGYRLRRERYGPETGRLIEEALEREHWGAGQWRRYKEERLALILRRAATQVPYYREQWAARRREGDRSGPDRLENWPILEKEALRRNPQAFLAEDCRPGRMVSLHTSGTSGTPLTLRRSVAANRAWYALFEARGRLWNGVDRFRRWANIGGQLVAPATSRRPPFWVWNRALSQLYMSSYHLAPDLVPAYLEALWKFKIEYLYGYSSSLHSLALGAAAHGGPADGSAPALRVALTNAEPLFDLQRQAIARAFGCAVRETYGMAEIAVAAGECPHGVLHEWPEVGHMELLEEGRAVADGEAGDVIATCLINPDMPLVRYRVGDRARRPKEGKTCPCGRTLPILAAIEGRVDDVLYTADGRRIGRLDPVFKSDLPVLEAQIVQESFQRIVLKYIPAEGFTSRHADSIAERIRERMGPVTVDFEKVDQIPRGRGGKFRAVVCRIPEEQLRGISGVRR